VAVFFSLLSLNYLSILVAYEETDRHTDGERVAFVFYRRRPYMVVSPPSRPPAAEPSWPRSLDKRATYCFETMLTVRIRRKERIC
jgi:hypothetical protein